MNLLINNHRWTLQDGMIYGLCEPTPRLITIDPRLRPRHRLEIVIHELLHALDNDLTEDVVVAQSQTIAEALWKDGWRRKVKKHG
jgi:hypothetical protein